MKRIIKIALIVLIYISLGLCCIGVIGKLFDIEVFAQVNTQLIVGIISGILAVLFTYLVIRMFSDEDSLVAVKDEKSPFEKDVENKIEDLTTTITTIKEDNDAHTIKVNDDNFETTNENIKIDSVVLEATENNQEDTVVQETEVKEELKIDDQQIVEPVQNKYDNISIDLTETQKSYIASSKTSYIDDNGNPQFYNTSTNTLKMREFKDYDVNDEIQVKQPIKIDKLVLTLLIILGVLIVVIIVLGSIMLLRKLGVING